MFSLKLELFLAETLMPLASYNFQGNVRFDFIKIQFYSLLLAKNHFVSFCLAQSRYFSKALLRSEM